MSSSDKGASIGLPGLLFLLFLALRLTDQVDWAWYWVAAPLWIPLGLALIVGAIFAVVEFRRE